MAQRSPATQPPASNAEGPLLQGRFLGPYRLRAPLGQGGFAPVWLADEIHESKKLREVAIKLFLTPPSVSPASETAAAWRERIIEEARALCRVEHPSIVRFYTLQRDDDAGIVGLVMEYVAGRNLDKKVDQDGAIDELAALEVAITVAWALSAVHEAGLIHRDVKPANIVACPSGYRLIDFGIAAARRELTGLTGEASSPINVRIHSGEVFNTDALTMVATEETALSMEAATMDATNSRSQKLVTGIAGTPGYMAPEYFSGASRASPSSDLYALGATLFRLLTTQIPAAPLDPATGRIRWSMDIMYGRARPARIDALVGQALSSALVELVDRLLDPDPRERPQHADWVARELEAIREQIAPERHVSGRPSNLPPPPATLQAPIERPLLLAEAPPLVGRDEILARIAQHAEEANAGSVRFVLMSGPLGMGRSRVLEAAIAANASHFPRILALRGSPERKGPLRPLIRALDSLGMARDTAPLAAAIDRALAPHAIGTPSELSEALEGVEEALVAMSREAPLLLSFDDLQWADAHSLALLTMLVDRAGIGGPGRILVLAAARSEPSPERALRSFLSKARARSRAGSVHIPLEPLKTEETKRLAQSLCPISVDLEEAIVRGSGNVPFYVVHPLRVWHETRALVLRDGVWHPRDEQVLFEDVPGVSDFIEARLGAYFDPESAEGKIVLRVLAAIALYGGGLALEVIAKATKGDEMDIESALETLLDASILVFDEERQEYAFAQEIVRLGLLNLTRRKPWFQRVYRGLLDVVARRVDAQQDAAFLAKGYEKLGAREDALVWLERAMEAAISAGLFAEVAALGDRRVALTADPERRAALELEIVKALVDGRKFEEARQRLDRIAVQAGSGRLNLLRRIYRLYVARGLRETGIFDEALLADADALAELPLRCEARMALAGVLPEERALPLAGEAIELASRCSEGLEFPSRVLRFELVYHANQRDLTLAAEDLKRALTITKASSSPWKQVHIEGDLAALEAELGQLDEAINRLKHLVEQSEAQGMRGQLRLLTHNLAAFLLRAGCAMDAAEVAARTARLAEEAGDPVLMSTSLSIRSDALRRSGDLEGALDAANKAVSSQMSRGDGAAALTLLRRAEIFDALKRGEEALSDAREAKHIAEQKGNRRLMITAMLWERLRMAQKGQTSVDELVSVMAEARATGFARRALIQSLLNEAERWIASASS